MICLLVNSIPTLKNSVFETLDILETDSDTLNCLRGYFSATPPLEG